MTGVDIRSIDKHFGDTPVLRNVSLNVGEREFMTLVGPSGCGKSTLLRIIAGLESQNGGSIAIGDRTVDGIAPAERDVAMVFQSYALYPHLTVAENIAVPLRMRRLSFAGRLPVVGTAMPGGRALRKEIDRDVRDIAALLDISHLLDRKPGQLSGGQRQRVALGRAMVRRPKAFLMDEPLSNLDAKLRVHMRAEIAQLHRRLDTAFVYVTHDQAEAMTMSDRLAVMMDGEILQVASPDEIYRDPVDIRVAEFIGSPTINILPVDLRGDGAVSLFGHTLPLIAETGYAGSARIGLRAEHMYINETEDADLGGRIVHAENLGSEVLLHLDVAGCQAPIVARIAPERAAGIAVGDDIGLDVALEKALLFAADGQRLTAAPAPNQGLAAHG